jgi:hypothetical protein
VNYLQVCKVVVLSSILTLVLSSTASAQATRTWVSGVGDDANPCSRTAPCKTWAGAISKTAAGGEIDALDPGGVGALTITKSLTLDGGGGQVASVLVAGTNGIVIAAAATDVVTLRNLDLDGLLGNCTVSCTSAGLDGVRIQSAGVVHLDNLAIFGFSQYGIEVAASASVNVAINNCRVTNTLFGAVGVATTSGTANVEIDGLRAYNTHPAILGGANSLITVANSDLAIGAKGVRQSAAGSTIDVVNSQLSYFTTAALESISGSTINASGNVIAHNALGINPNGGIISSDARNTPIDNTSNGTFNGSAITKF